MTLTWDEACAAVTAPGSLLELKDGPHGSKVFANAPGSMRDVFALARDGGDATFLVYEDERWSFDDVFAAVDAFADALVNRYGVAKGERVAVAMRNYPEWVVAFVAIISVGAVNVSLNALWTADELAYGLEDCGATILVADQERVARSAPTCSRLGTRVIEVRPDVPTPGVDQWSDVVVLGPALPDIAVAWDDDATILYTSGTTGRPKGAVSTNGAVVSSLMSFAARAAVDGAMAASGAAPGAPAEAPTPMAFILIVPLFHVTGCVAVMLACFVSKAKLVMMYRWDVDKALDLIEREHVTHFVGVPTQSWDLVNSPAFATHDTSSLTNVGGGGAPARPALVEKVAERVKGGGPIIGYGMTETNAFGPGNSGPDYLTHPSSTGRSFPTLRVEIRDPSMHPVPIGERGEIWFNGPMLIRGYWNKPEATAETIIDGWLRTGDVGRLDRDGFLYIEDRLKDMILRGGENVYSAEVEAAIYEHPGVHEAAVFGLPHERFGEEVAAAVYPADGQSLTAEELQAYLKGKIAAFKIPSRIFVLDAPLPRNPAGKFLKRDLRDTYSVT